MGLFKEIAEPLVTRGVPVMPLRPKTKIAFFNDWPRVATTNSEQIQKWDEEFPNANGACVAHAHPDGVWFFEIDKPGFIDELQAETGQILPETFMVRSSPGRGHLYFRHNASSISLAEKSKVIKAVQDKKEVWSARLDNAYVVAPGSYHPVSGLRYETLRDVDIAIAPDWLIAWCKNQAAEDEKLSASVDGPKIPRGSHDTTLTRIAGKLRQDGLEEEAIYAAIVEVCEKRCEGYGSDYREMARKISHSVCRYPIKEAAPVIMGGVVLGQPQVQPVPEPVNIAAIPYPIFPRWCMKGTSVYDGLIEPICKANSRYPEFMFMPAVALILNYLAGKVRVEYKNLIPSFYMVSIGRKGLVIKSSSVKDVVEYLNHAGIVNDAGPHTRNAEGKSLIFTPGSSEGLGMEMSRTNCKNAVLFYDELSILTSKAGIDGSSLIPNLLLMYESQKFSNSVKSRKEIYNFEPNSYCTSLIACTTDKNFLQNWSKMAGNSSGLDERFFFLYQPEVLKEPTPYIAVDTKDAAVETRKRLDKAIKQQLYRITDSTPLEMKIGKLGNRTEIRAEKLALYFAIDLGRDEIDEECVDRAIAICEYEIAVKKYLKVFESASRESMIQNEMIQALQRNQGRLEKRKFEKLVHPLRHGLSVFNKCYMSLIAAGYIAEYGSGVKGDPQMVILLRNVEEDE